MVVHRPVSPLLGRAADSARLARALDAGARLITVTGQPGVGKTTLARATLAAHPGPAGGLIACPASPCDHPSELRLAVLDAAGVPPEARPAVELGALLAERGAVWLWLDEIEALLPDAAAVVAGWLEEAPGLQVVVSSRHPLGLPGEQVLTLAGLPTDAPPGALSVAAELFVRRAGLPSPAGEEVAVLNELARRLDGLPLALELAAGRALLLGPAELLHRLDRRFDLLRDPGGGPGRSTLWHAIEVSWRRLSPVERQVMVGLAVCPGPVSATTVEALVPPLASKAAAPLDALTALEALVAASMVVVERAPSGAPRVSMPENIRAFVRAAAAPEALGAARLAHARWAIGRAAIAAPEAMRFEAARHLGAALRCLAEQPELPPVSRPAVMGALLAVTGTLFVGREIRVLYCRAVRWVADAPENEIRLRLNRARLQWTRLHGDEQEPDSLDDAADDLEHALTLARRHRLEALEIECLANLAYACMRQPDIPRARMLVGQCVGRIDALAGREALPDPMFRMIGFMPLFDHEPDRWMATLERARDAALHAGREVDGLIQQVVLGRYRVFVDGCQEAAVFTLRDVWQVREARGYCHRHLLASGGVLAEAELLCDRPDAARAVAEQLAVIARRLGLRLLEGQCLITLAYIALAAGDPPGADRHLDRCFGLMKGMPVEDALCVAVMVAAEADRCEEAERRLIRLRTHRRATAEWPELDMAYAWDDCAMRTIIDLARVRRHRTLGRFAEARALLAGAAAAWAPVSDTMARQPAVAFAWRYNRALIRRAFARLGMMSVGATPPPRLGWTDDVLLGLDDARQAVHRPGRAPIALDRSAVAWRMLRVLADHHRAAPGAPLEPHALVARVWPDEAIDPLAAVNRLRVTLSALRKRGLRELIETVDGGYRLAPALRVVDMLLEPPDPT